jgi:hypothetical protein
MKKLVFFLPAFLLISACSGSDSVEVGNKTTMQVDPVFDAGIVVKGEKVKAQFIVRNTGKYPLVIAEVKPSCSCTVGSKPEDPIQPGEDGIIKAEIDTDRTASGIISKTLRIVANTEPSVTEVAIKAQVKSN